VVGGDLYGPVEVDAVTFLESAFGESETGVLLYECRPCSLEIHTTEFEDVTEFEDAILCGQRGIRGRSGHARAGSPGRPASLGRCGLIAGRLRCLAGAVVKPVPGPVAVVSERCGRLPVFTRESGNGLGAKMRKESETRKRPTT